MTAALVCVTAILLDALLGEPRRGHPLAAFGRLALWLEARLNAGGHSGCRKPSSVPEQKAPSPARGRAGEGARQSRARPASATANKGFCDTLRGDRWAGLLALSILVLPPVALAAWLAFSLSAPWLWLCEVLVLYLALGRRSLAEHARAVALPLVGGDLAGAREQVARMVSRDTGQLDETGVAAAATESVLENGADAVFASLFWYLVAGLPGVVLHRLVNTLDAMWGYRNARFERFGFFAARLDDVLGWIPARLTALGYALAGDTRAALQCWRAQARQWSSPNAGPVMAAGAGALGLRLGGPAPYGEGWRDRAVLGPDDGEMPGAASLLAAVRLLRRSLLLWLVGIITGGVLWSLITAAG